MEKLTSEQGRKTMEDKMEMKSRRSEGDGGVVEEVHQIGRVDLIPDRSEDEVHHRN